MKDTEIEPALEQTFKRLKNLFRFVGKVINYILLIYVLTFIMVFIIFLDEMEITFIVMFWLGAPLAIFIYYMLTKDVNDRINTLYRNDFLRPEIKNLLPDWLLKTKCKSTNMQALCFVYYQDEVGATSEGCLYKNISKYKVWVIESSLSGPLRHGLFEVFSGAVIKIETPSYNGILSCILDKSEFVPNIYCRKDRVAYKADENLYIYAKTSEQREKVQSINEIKLILRYCNVHRIPLDRICISGHYIFVTIPYDQHFFNYSEVKDLKKFINTFRYTYTMIDDLVKFALS